MLDEIDRPDLTRRLERALDVAERAVDALGATGYEDADDPSLDVSSEKIVAETAMLLWSASHPGVGPEVGRRVRDLAGVLVEPARSDAVLARAALQPSLALGLAVPHVLLTRLGHPDIGVDEFFRCCIASVGARGHELPPYGALEKLWVRGLWGLPSPADEWQPVLRGSVLGLPLDVLGGLREDAYALTHGLMYVTDFGARRRLLPRPAEAVLADARALLAVYVDSGDYDLVGELLMAWPFLCEPPCPTVRFVFRLLTAVEDRVGLVPGGTTNAARLRSLTGERRRLYALATAYHTAYVMGMLCAASLRPMPAVLATAANTGFVLDSGIEVEQPDVEQVLGGLSDAERGQVGPFLLDLALAGLVRRRAYGQVAELLQWMDESGRPVSNLATQAKELLVRLASGLSPRAEAMAVAS